ncbi:VOC family protein [Streptomyces sp. SP18CS02]|uniref:VOC family protein n=1 Tax=Streptomyces sp. SP18CS02 TaxID=3002531 RepID=UPI002E77162E|nr:VOC family protein [Streptomyces sp. SP18CS02]MEE1752967.1 glyoxalase [Streptomyces sp. SP18CS02]
MTETTIRANETVVPVLPCADLEETLAFYQALGFEVTYRQTRPYLYLALEWSGFAVHFGRPPQDHDPAREDGGACLVMVEEVAAYHAAFTEAMRAAYRKVPAKGLPRITRFRPGQTRFTLLDPSGNSLIFIQRDEPVTLEYGGSRKLRGLARALDNARILREFKNDDRAAFRAVSSALRRHGDAATALDRALALATLIALATALDEREHIDAWTRELERIHLTDAERERVSDELRRSGT